METKRDPMPPNLVDKCPLCGKGSLHPKGYRKKPENPIPEGGFRLEYDSTEFECDNCHHVVRGVGVSRDLEHKKPRN
jgi:hypothetical protein